jgi:DNA-binding response OmpR family regulator
VTSDPVVLVVNAGAPDAAAIVRALAGELAIVRGAGLDALERAVPEDAVIVLALAAPVSATVVARAIAWADRAAPRPGVIGCAPLGLPADAELALACGVDDIMIGAPSARELAARVRAVDRRVHRAARIPERMRFGALVIALGAQVVWVDGRPYPLTRMEFGVLRALIAAGGAALTRAALLDLAWGARKDGVGLRAVDNVIVSLRRRLGEPDHIHTVRGVGFRLVR